MENPLHVESNDPVISQLKFHSFRSCQERQAVQFLPGPGEPQTMEITTAWGETLTCKSGDYLVNEIDAPEDRWVVDQDIFLSTYLQIGPGRFVKDTMIHLVPLTDLTGGDPNKSVAVHTLEGVVTVRAADFYLARGIEGELWPYPKDKAHDCLSPADGE